MDAKDPKTIDNVPPSRTNSASNGLPWLEPEKPHHFQLVCLTDGTTDAAADAATDADTSSTAMAWRGGLLVAGILAGASADCPHRQWFDSATQSCRPLTTCTGAQYESAAPTQAWGYEKQQFGTCAHAIHSETECELAAKELGVVDTTAEDDLQKLGVIWDPQGCYFESGQLKHHMYGTNSGLCTQTDTCICRKRGQFTSDRACMQVETCGAGTFEHAHPTSTADRVCKPLTVCGDSEYQSVKPRHAWVWALLTDGVCDKHVESSDECNAAARFLSVRDTTSEADQQPQGVSWDPSGCYHEFGYLKHHLQMRNTGKCTVIDQCLCRTNSYLAGDRACAPVRTCSAQEYETAVPGDSSNRECARLTACDAQTQYQSTDRACTDLTTCTEGTEYEAKAPTTTSNRECRTLTTCRAGLYEATPPPTRFHFLRQTWGRCEEPIRAGLECSTAAAELGLRDTAAKDDGHKFGVSWDPDGCYYENGSLKHHRSGLNTGMCSATDQCLCRGDSYAAGDRVCKAPSACSTVQFQVHAPTDTSDRVCAALTECQGGEWEASAPIAAAASAADVRRLGDSAAAPTHHFSADRQCQKHSTDCKPGTYETVTAGAHHDRQCTPCPPGTAQPNAGQGRCEDCSESYADSPGQVSCTPFASCPAGSARSGSSSVSGGTCAACPEGQAKTSAGNWVTPCLPCLPGTFATAKGSVQCSECEAGKYQPWTGRPACTSCPLGRFTAVAGRTAEAHCLLCPTGKFAAQEGSAVCDVCRGGRFGSADASATHSGHCIACPTGKFQTADGQTSCGHCPSGKYQHMPQQIHCHACSEHNPPYTLGKIDELHFYWTANRAGANKCVAHPVDCLPSLWGTWSTCDRSCGVGTSRRSRTQARTAWGGGKACTSFEWQQVKDCTSGECPVDCTLSSWSQWAPCSRSCGGGSARRTRSVTRAAVQGGIKCGALSQTQACNVMLCAVDCKIGEWGTWGPCTKACGNGQKTRTRFVTAPKLGGKACPTTQDESYCNSQCCAGTFHSHGFECEHCSSGKYAAKEGAMWCQSCPEGQYQVASGKSSCHHCPAGTHQPAVGRDSSDHCMQCNLGQYQPASSARACIACPAGRFNANTGSTLASACENCKAGQFSAAASASTCESCEAGQFQVASGQAICTACTMGRYSPVKGSALAEYCYDCACGKWSRSGASVCATCEAGRFRSKKGGQNVGSCSQTAAGHATAEGACAQTVCAAGRFQSTGGAAECNECPAGRSSAATGAQHVSACKACTAGTWSLAAALKCTHCEAGRFNAMPAMYSKTACKVCTPGWYSASLGTTSCTMCELGRWQAASAAHACTQCDAGTANDQRGAKTASACVPCSTGKSQATAGQVACTACAAGSYSGTTGSAACTDCEHGTANAAAGSTSASACKPCAAGSYAPDAGSTRCVECALGKSSQHAAATSAAACVHCSAGQYADSLGQAVCKKCAGGRFGEAKTGAIDNMLHCLKCPAGKFQQADGMAVCAECESGKFTAMHHDMVQCEACAQLDSARKYTTGGLAGQSSCQPVPLDCQPSMWGAWGECSHSCGGVGKRTRTRHPMHQPAAPSLCGLEDDSQCAQAWGGGLACELRQWSSTEDCNPDACPADCVVSQWGSFEPCTKTCGSGGTKRVRAITKHAQHGGKGCPPLRDPVQGLKLCNTHECGWHALPACHLSHVRCNVIALSHPNSHKKRPDLPGCAWSVIEDQNRCWNNRNCKTAPSQVCHDPDGESEKALGERLEQQYAACIRHGDAIGDEARAHFKATPQTCQQRFGTLVVTHDRLNMQKSLGVQRNAFHCKKTSVGCSCTCRKHPPCCSHARKVLVNALILGASYRNVATMQDCCDMCTNHPKCTSWEYTGDGLCSLKEGAPQMASSDSAVWAGTHSGAAC